MPTDKIITPRTIPETGKIDTITKIIQISEEIPGGNYWTTKTSLTESRTACSRFSADGFYYVSTGLTSGTGRRTSTEQYNDSTNSWATRANYGLTGVSGPGDFVLGFVYVGFGINSSSVDVATLTSYNTSADSWLTKSSSSSNRRSIGGFSLNSYGYAVRGIRGVSGVVWLNVNEQYNESSNSWTTKTAALQVGDGVTGFSMQGYGFSTHGRSAAGAYLATSLRYDDSLNSWITSASAIGAARMPTGGGVINGLGYATGGWNGANTANNDQFEFDTNVWSLKAPNLTALENPGIGSHNGNGYICGGDDGNVGVGLANVTQYKNYHLVTIGGILKRSSSVPRSISALAISDDKNVNVPIQVRTDGSNWRLMTTGLRSDLKIGEMPAAVFGAGNNNYREYEARVGVPIIIGSSTSGFWTAKASLSAAVDLHCHFSAGGFGHLSNGRTSGGVAATTAFKYDDFINSWAAIASMAGARFAMGNFMLNALGYSCGGTTNADAASSTTVYKYTQILNSWVTTTALPTALYVNGAFSLNSYGYSYGGQSSASVALSAVNRYDDSTAIWSSVAPLAIASRNFRGFSVNGYGFSTHGIDVSSLRAPVNDMYNDAANSWTARASGSLGRSDFASFKSADRPYVGCGNTGSATTSVLDEYIESINIWMVRSSNPTARSRSSGFAVNESGYIAGGNTSTSGGANLSSVHRYITNDISTQLILSLIIDESPIQVPANGAWTVRAVNPVARSGITNFGINNRSLCALGNNSSTAFTRADNFDDSLNSWTVTGSVATARRYAGSFVTDGFGFAIGGYTFAGSAIANNDRYDPSLGTWAVRTSITQAAYGRAGFDSALYGYAMGGSNGANLGTMYRYDNLVNAWTALSNIPEVVSFPSSFTIDEIGYLTHGSRIGGNSLNAHMYNQPFNSWSIIAPATVARSSAAGFSLNKSGFVAAGGTGTQSAVLEEYLSASNIWVLRDNIGQARDLTAGSNVGSSGFVCCGQSGAGGVRSNRMDRYLP